MAVPRPRSRRKNRFSRKGRFPPRFLLSNPPAAGAGQAAAPAGSGGDPDLRADTLLERRDMGDDADQQMQVVPAGA